VFERVKRTAQGAQNSEMRVRLAASDISQKATMAAKNNIERSGFTKDINLRCADALDFNADGGFGGEGLVISNLPYGKRAFADGGTEAFHERFGANLKKNCRGWHFGFVLSDRESIQALGLPVTSELRFENGGIPVLFVSGKL
jgi:23S rRNA G2445 N2-methylase RlmL